MNTQEAIEILERDAPNYADFLIVRDYDDAVLKYRQAITHAIEHMKRGQWQPIETAPRREPFIATGKTETPCVVTTTAPKNENVGYPFCCYHTQVCFHESKFTHWMPLPAAPRSELLCSQSKELCSPKGETK